MTKRLNEREKRVILLGAVAAVAILAFTFGADWLEGWAKARTAIAAAGRQLQDVRENQARQEALLAIVPACEAPEPAEKQKFLFRDRLHEQLKKAGIKTEPPDILPVRKTKQVPYGVLKIACQGKCKLDQLLDFLAALNENAYLVGIEELRIRCNPKEAPDKRKEIEFDLTVSTFVD